MFWKVLGLSSFTVLPLLIGTSALAQSGAAVPAPAEPAPSTPSTYQLSGTGIAPSGELNATTVTGTSTPSLGILTAPVNASATAYRTESGVFLYPTLLVGYGYDDNLTRTNTGQISSSFVRLVPELMAELKNKGDRYTAKVNFAATRYMDSENDNATTALLELAGDNYFSSRAQAGWVLARVDGVDPRGFTQRTVSAEPDKWHSNNLNGRFAYGAQEASGRFEFDLGTQAKTYDNNRDVTTVADVTLNSMAGRFFYRVGPRTKAVVEYRNAKANYVSDQSTDDNTEQRYYAGLTWEATAATTGTVKVGRMTKEFDLASKQGYGGSSWEAGVRWSPKTYSIVDLQTTRSTADSTGVGDYTLNTSTSLGWSHKWNQSLGTRVLVSVLGTDFVGSGRVDNALGLGFMVEYNMLRWLKIGLDFGRTDNSSNDPTQSYKRNVTGLTLNATL